ncbi:MAG: ABC transporter permease [Eubacteriales bacterium]|nr:ABC transporter permease [Eubacteriales bacterium]
MRMEQLMQLLWTGLLETLYMTIPATLIAYLIGMPLGVLLVVTRKNHMMPAPRFNTVLGAVINFLRSIPFIILLVLLFPVTRAVMGSGIGTRSVIFPLIISAFPYIARMVEGSLNEVDRGIIEAAQSMGSTSWQLIRKVLIPEAMPSLVNGAAICMVTILSYTAMSSAAGGGGLGTIAIVKGLNMRQSDIMYSASILLVLLVQLISLAGSYSTKRIDHRN